jgi:hypothetical protein
LTAARQTLAGISAIRNEQSNADVRFRVHQEFSHDHGFVNLVRYFEPFRNNNI